MNKRSLFLCAALGLLASLAFTAPSQANFITSVSLDNNTGVAVNDLTTVWNGTGGSINTVVSPLGPAMVPVGNTIVINFTNPVANGGNVTFTFQTTTTPIAFSSGTWSFTSPNGTEFTTPVDATRDKLTYSTAAIIPEPTSMALLGIGMTGFFAFRRFFRRTAVA